MKRSDLIALKDYRERVFDGNVWDLIAYFEEISDADDPDSPEMSREVLEHYAEWLGKKNRDN